MTKIIDTSLRISIHALRKESDIVNPCLRKLRVISIHALRKESDPRGRRRHRRLPISIHALRKESDRGDRRRGDERNNFNPRSP